MQVTDITSLFCYLLLVLLGIAVGSCILSRRKAVIARLESITAGVTNIPIQGFYRDGTIFLWNRASELTYGFLRKDVVGKKLQDLILVDSEKDVFLESVEQIHKNGKALPPHKWNITTRSGQRRTMYSTMFPEIRHGKCAGVFCVDVDITDIMTQHERVADARESYKSIFDGINEAIYVIDPNDGRFIFVNAQGCRLVKYSEEELSKLSIEDISTGDKESISEKIKTVTAKVFYEGPQEFAWQFCKKSGEVFDAEVNLEKGFVAKRKCVIASVRDITSWKQKEVRLHQEEKRYRELLKNSNSLVFYLDENGKVTSVNEAVKKFFGYEINEALNRHFTEFLCEEDHEKGYETFKKVMSGEQVNNIEFNGLSKIRERMVMRINIWPEYNAAGQIIGIYGDAVDITDEKMMLDKMREMVIQIISMLSETVSVADRYTEEHCERLQDLSLKIGKALGLTEKRLEHLKFAALLHDVGKVGIPIHILIKKGKLTDEEWKKIKEHPKKGADIVRQLSGFEEVAQIIEQHQERCDGKGYPKGLSGDKIKKEAAIISVVDAFDAMTSDRPYRKAMSTQEAVKELQKNSGTQFDPDVVNAFVKIIESQPEKDIL